MSKKYYTPRLEEFRIGFKYEIRHYSTMENYKQEPQDWFDKVIVNGWDQNEFYYIKNRLKETPQHIRVKYLDRSDIESCGFEWLGKVTSHTFQMNNNKIRLKYYDDSNELFISHELRRKLFDGVVKNLNEFKMVLDMIGVEYER